MDHITTGIGWLDWLLLAAAVLSALGAGYKVLSDRVFPVYRKIDDFLDDWNGRPERPGVKKQSGVMERLSQLEHNGGASIKDSVTRIESKLDNHIADSSKLMAEGAREWATHQHDAQKRDQEIDRLRDQVEKLTDVLPIIAKSVPPEE